MSDRKYRQRGYQDHDREPERPRSPQAPRQSTRNPAAHEAPRSPKMMAFGEIVKCSSCGAKVTGMVGLETSCAKCRTDLHTCRQCESFDPGARFECNKKVATRIVNKNARNNCELFSTRTVVERETSSGAPTDARQAFANLFKK